MSNHHIQTDEFSAYFDDQLGIRCITYGRVHNRDIMWKTFTWSLQLAEDIGYEQVRAAIFDYRHIEEFEAGNSLLSRQHYHEIQKRFGESYPVVYIVSNLSQEQMARIIIYTAGMSKSGYIARSKDEAIALIEDWLKKADADIPSETDSKS